MLFINRLMLCTCFMVLSPIIASAQDIAGRYTVMGINEDGSAYAGFVDIVDSGSAFTLTWEDKGKQYAAGLGLLEGQVLSVIFQTSTGDIGLASYRREAKALVGRWLFPGHPKINTETLTPMDPRLDDGPRQKL